jgi:hypothetical protein
MGSVVLLIGLIFYVGAVMATKLFGAAHPEWFGSIGASLYTLFQVMTLESWSMGIVRPVMETHPLAWAFFVPFILVTTFAVLNLLVGLVVNAMQEAAEADRPRRRTSSRPRCCGGSGPSRSGCRAGLKQRRIRGLDTASHPVAARRMWAISAATGVRAPLAGPQAPRCRTFIGAAGSRGVPPEGVAAVLEDPVLLARMQFAANITFHILFPTITIALGWMLLFMKVRFTWTRDGAWMELYRFWVKVFALTFSLGVVSGIVMSFQFGTNWPGFMNTVGNIAGPLLAYEIMTAFFLEAVFIGVMLFGHGRVPAWAHTVATALVAIGTTTVGLLDHGAVVVDAHARRLRDARRRGARDGLVGHRLQPLHAGAAVAHAARLGPHGGVPGRGPVGVAVAARATGRPR